MKDIEILITKIDYQKEKAPRIFRIGVALFSIRNSVRRNNIPFSHIGEIPSCNRGSKIKWAETFNFRYLLTQLDLPSSERRN